VWKGCLTTLGTCILQPLRTLRETATPNFDANLTPIPAAVSKRTLLLSMLPSFFVLFYPMLYPIASAVGLAPAVPAGALALALVWPWVGMSLIWTLLTQTSHVQEACQPDGPSAADEPDCWTARQIGTALDYSVGSPYATALTAGLNNQGLHHAMPTISMAHFPGMYAEYEAVCKRHGVTPRQTDNLATATREMLEYIFALNDAARTPAEAPQAEPAKSREGA
jgi:fatty acid desaturase